MPTIDTLLNLVPDSPSTVLSHLRSHPDTATQGDSHGYTLFHAAASYEQFDLVKALVEEFHFDPNAVDEDGETALFFAESEAMAAELLRLGVDPSVTNLIGITAMEKLDDQGEFPLVAKFLHRRMKADYENHAYDRDDDSGGGNSTAEANEDASLPSEPPPPPLPPGVEINLGTIMPEDVGDAPDPHFRRRIEDLVARDGDFAAEDTQRELRLLVSDAVSGLHRDAAGQLPPSSARRRMG